MNNILNDIKNLEREQFLLFANASDQKKNKDLLLTLLNKKTIKNNTLLKEISLKTINILKEDNHINQIESIIKQITKR